MNLAIKIIEST